MARKPISDIVKKKLFSLSGNQCYFDGCTERVYDLEDEVVLAEMCHIIAVNSSGARYDPDFPEEEINSFDNLMLLCPNHHTKIDKNEEKYDVNYLKKIKLEHESKFYDNALVFEGLVKSEDGEINKKRLTELEEIDKTFTPKVTEKLPSKKQYTRPENYIKRYINSIRDGSDYNVKSVTLTDILEKENRITILGVAGSGKSIELNYIAHLHSQDTSDLYPVKVRLNTITKQDIEEIIRLEYSDFDKVPQKKMLILLDALDEVHSDYMDVVVRNIIIFSQKYKQAKIIVSCRNNFYTTENRTSSAKLDGFKTHLIQPLNYFSILEYINENVIGSEIFISDLKQKKFFDLLYSPFYLVNLVAYYIDNKVVPDSKKVVFNYLINQRMRVDIDKYVNSGIQIEDYLLKIESKIEQLAVVAESLGRNYLYEKDEVLALIPDTKILNVIKRTFLFNKSINNDQWEFEHNNFQEFLAAKYLSKLNFEKIKQFVSFEPNFTKIKPTWLNTLSFLFSILKTDDEKYQKLVDWIIDVEPDILVRFEKDKIDIDIRERIFKDIYESYESKNIIIRNEKFESEDLAFFVSDSHSIIKYLLKKIKLSDEKLVVSEIIRLFNRFDFINNYKDEIENILLDKICRSEISDEIKYNCLYGLASLKICTEHITKRILDTNSLKSGQYIRAGFYKYIENSKNLEDYLNVLLEGVSLVNRPMVSINGSGGNENHLSDEKYNLENTIDKIDTPNGLKRILKWGITHEKHSSFDDLFFELIGKTLKKSVGIYNSDEKDVLDLVLEMMLSFYRRFYKDIGEDFKYFFSETKTELIAFKFLFEKSIKDEARKIDYGYAMAIACNKDCVDYIIKEIKSEKIKEEHVIFIRNILGWDGDRTIHNLYYEEIKKINKEKYSYNEIDHNALRKLQKERDVQLLFAKNEFLEEAIDIFQKESDNKTRLTRDELYDYNKKRFRDENMDNQIILSTLQNFSRDKEYVDLKEIENLVNNEDRWTWFVIHKLVSYDKNIDFEFEEKARDYLINWVRNNIEKAQYKTAIKNKENNFNYRFLELYIPYFVQRLDIKLLDEQYLDLLFVDCFLLPKKQTKTNNNIKNEESILADFVYEKVGLQKISDRIIINLNDDALIDPVKKNYFKFCDKHNIKEALPFIFKELISDSLSDYDKRDLVDYYLNLEGNMEDLYTALDKFEIELKFHSISRLIEYNHASIKSYCVNQISIISDQEIKLRFIKMIAKINESESLKYLKPWILENKRLPDREYNFDKIEIDQLGDLIEIFEDSLENKYGSGSWGNNISYYLQKIIELGSTNKTVYVSLKEKLERWIGNYPDTKYLHYHIKTLEQSYYSKKSQAFSFEEINELINLSSIPKYKKNIENNNLFNQSIEDIINEGEGNQIELKSSLRLCLKTNKPQKYIGHTVLKNIAAFLNTNGGVLLIGVEDNRNVLGLEETDYTTFNGHDKKDDFMTHLDSQIQSFLGNHYNAYLKISSHTYEEKTIIKIYVDKANSQAFLVKDKDGKKVEDFYIRRNASTVKLSMKEAIEYSKKHWN